MTRPEDIRLRTADLEFVTGVGDSNLRFWMREGHIKPPHRSGKLYFWGYMDAVALATAEALRQRGVASGTLGTILRFLSRMKFDDFTAATVGEDRWVLVATESKAWLVNASDIATVPANAWVFLSVVNVFEIARLVQRNITKRLNQSTKAQEAAANG